MTVPRIEIAPGYAVPRIITGAWQLSAGHARDPIPRDLATRRCAELLDRGFTAFDCADIYTGVEGFLGDFLRQQAPSSRQRVQIHTKLVPDRSALSTVDRGYVQRIVDRSLRRLGVERLDLVQFHWWDYAVPGYLDVAGWLAELQHAGKIRLLAATNFDAAHCEEITASGVELVTNQVQYSLLDARPEHAMLGWCASRGAWLLCYGVLAGGYLSDAYIGMTAPPERPANRSHTKYGLIIDEFGGWELYQELLVALAQVAARHDVPLSTAALRWVLERPRVAAVIVGLSRRDRVRQNLAAFSFRMQAEDRELVDAVLARRLGPRGKVFELERDPDSRHAAVMRYDLNREA